LKQYCSIVFVVLLFLAGCKDAPVGNEKANIPPQAFLWIFPDNADTLASGISKQKIHWWGEDRDGFVVGFLIGVSKNEADVVWSFKTKNDSTIAFPLLVALDTFKVFVRAIDNHFLEKVNDGGRIVFASTPYWDKDSNGVFSSKDVTLPTLKRSVGLTVSQKFPVHNSPPSATFEINDANETVQPPETTFTVITFAWHATDPDGDNTIANYEIALNDTAASRWATIPKSATLVTLLVPRSVSNVAGGEVAAEIHSGTYGTMPFVGIVQGLKLDDTNRIFLRAKDVAGDFSPVVSLPDSGFYWYVKKPMSSLLVVEDYVSSSGFNSRDSVKLFYRKIFAQIASGPYAVNPDIAQFDFMSLRSKDSAAIKAHLNPAFIVTLQLFDYVFWYAGQEPSWATASNPLFLFAVDPATHGRVLFSTGFNNDLADPRGSLVNFAPIEAVSIRDDSTASRAYPDTVLRPIGSDVDTGFVPLQFRGGTFAHNLFYYRHLYRRSTARDIYQIDSIVSRKEPNRPKFSPTVGVIDVSNRFVVMGAPLHLLNGNGQLPIFLNKVFGDIFKRN
jgi:hypothetical protein